MIKIFLAVLIIFVNCSFLHGKTPDSLKPRDLYIGKTDTLINFKINGNNDFEWYNISGENQDGSKFEYDLRPNIALSHHVSVSYRIIAFGFSFKLPFIPGNDDNELEGKTKSFGFGMEILGDHFMQKLNYSKTKGYYLYNSEDFKQPGWEPTSDDPYLTSPDLKSIEYFGYSGYKFNPNFSLKALTSQSEIQLKSCGSFLVLIDYRYLIIDNKSDDPAQTSSQRSRSFDMQLNAGYAYTLVINKHFYLTAGVIPGYGFKYTDLLTRQFDENIKNDFTDPVVKLNLRTGIGYNSRSFFAGFEFSGSAATSRQRNTTAVLNNDRVYAQVFIGYRFKAPRFLQNQEEKVEIKMHQQLEKLKK